MEIDTDIYRIYLKKNVDWALRLSKITFAFRNSRNFKEETCAWMRERERERERVRVREGGAHR